MTPPNPPPPASPEMTELIDDLIDATHHAAWMRRGRDEPDVEQSKHKLLSAIATLEARAKEERFYREAWNGAVELCRQIAERVGYDMDEMTKYSNVELLRSWASYWDPDPVVGDQPSVIAPGLCVSDVGAQVRTIADALGALSKAVAGCGKELADDTRCGEGYGEYLCTACDSHVMPAIRTLLGHAP